MINCCNSNGKGATALGVLCVVLLLVCSIVFCSNPASAVFPETSPTTTIPFDFNGVPLDETTAKALKFTMDTIRTASVRAFTGFYSSQKTWIGGYKALVLARFCPDVYGSHYSGEVPPVLTSGFIGPTNHQDESKAIARPCRDRALVENLLHGYWNVTAPLASAYFERVVRLSARDLSRVPVHLFTSEGQSFGLTEYTENVLRSGGDSNALASAIRTDAILAINGIFGSLEFIMSQALELPAVKSLRTDPSQER